MVRDVRIYTSNLDLSSSPAADRGVQDLSARNLLKTIRGTTNRDAAANRNSSDPPETPPVDNPSDGWPGGDSSASPEQGSPTGSGGGSESDGSSGILASGAASRGDRGSLGGSASRGARGGRGGTAPRGGRGGSMPQRPTTRSVAQAPSARSITALRRLAYFTKGKFPDITHNDDPVSFVEYAYSVKITQPNVPGAFQEAMQRPDAEHWRAVSKKIGGRSRRPSGLQVGSSLDSSSWDTCIQIEVGVQSQC